MATPMMVDIFNQPIEECPGFPLLCRGCLQTNPFVEMVKEPLPDVCKICTGTFRVFRWSLGPNVRFRKTEICQTCSRMKNSCQACFLQLDTLLPMPSNLDYKENIPRVYASGEYCVESSQSEVFCVSPNAAPGIVRKPMAAFNLPRSAPAVPRSPLRRERNERNERNSRPHACTFWARNECIRGEECPYRHERPMDSNDTLGQLNAIDRDGQEYFIIEPVTGRLLPPENPNITTLFVGNIGHEITEVTLYSFFSRFGKVICVKRLPDKQCAFIEYGHRKEAEKAAEKCFGKVTLSGKKLTISWARTHYNIFGPEPSRARQRSASELSGPLEEIHSPLELNKISIQSQMQIQPEMPLNYFQRPRVMPQSQMPPPGLFPQGFVSGPRQVFYPSRSSFLMNNPHEIVRQWPSTNLQ